MELLSSVVLPTAMDLATRIHPDQPEFGVMIPDNIILVTGSLPIIRGDATSGITFSGNDYWKPDGAFLVSWAGVQYTSLNAWQTATGQESGTGFAASPPLLLSAVPSPTPTSPPLPFTISSTDPSFNVNDVRGSIFQRPWYAYHYNALTVTTVWFATNP
jgi:hypothetical protein